MEFLYVVKWVPHDNDQDVSYSIFTDEKTLAEAVQSVLGEASYDVEVKEVTADCVAGRVFANGVV